MRKDYLIWLHVISTSLKIPLAKLKYKQNTEKSDCHVFHRKGLMSSIFEEHTKSIKNKDIQP